MKTHYQYYILEFPTCPKLLLWDWPVRISLSVHWQLQNIHAGCQNINMSWAGRKGTKHNNTQKKNGAGHTHTDSDTGRMCVLHAAVESRTSEVGYILRALISCFGMSHLHSHSHTGTTVETRALRPCGQPMDQALLCVKDSWGVISLASVSMHPDPTDSSMPKHKRSFREALH